MTTASDPGQRPDAFADVRPRRLRQSLAFWAAISVLLHGAGAGALAASPGLRNWVFSSLRSDGGQQAGSAAQIRAARAALDQLTRQRLIESNRKMLAISRQVEDLRAKEWEGVASRAAGNGHYRRMHDAGLPPLALSHEPGDAVREDVPKLYDRARDLERQVIALYEQYRAVGMSLMTVRTGRGADVEPQSLDDSLALARLERPLRADLDRALLAAQGEALLAAWSRWREHMTLASDAGEVMVNNCQRILEVIVRVDPVIESGPGGQTPAGPARTAWSEGSPYRGEPLRQDELVQSDLESFDPKATITLGRHLGAPGSSASRSADWLAVDSWWCIGPFPYLSGRRSVDSLDHAYPPEHGVDLDATYIGKNGRPLRWQFRPMAQVRMEPRDVYRESIWYFASELWCDRPCEVVANIASDDFGALWLNGKQVYRSGTEARPWVVLDRRQVCRLSLRQGTNRLLLKLDNQGGTTGFSVLLNLQERTAAIAR